MGSTNDSIYVRPANDGKVRPCEGCGNPHPWARHPKKEAITGRIYEECNHCFDSSISSHPDVYFKQPYWDESLYDQDDSSSDPEKGTFVRSRAHKAYLLKKLGWREGGDFRHGSRNSDPISQRYAEAALRR